MIIFNLEQMKSMIAKVLFLFYKYYDKGSTKNIAYFSSIIALIMIITINLLSIIILLGLIDYIPLSDNSKGLNYIFVCFFYFTPLIVLIRKKFKREDILKVQMKNTIKRAYFFLISYILISILFLVFVINNGN